MDSCKIRPGLYQFTAVDDCSRYLVAGISARRTAAAALIFLNQVLEEMPFLIQRLQTDRGTEFFAEEVQRRLMAETIRFRPIPPRSPHLNGRTSRTDWPSGCITTIGIGHTSLCTAYRRSTACASAPTRRPYRAKLATPMNLPRSAFRFAITLLTQRYER
jgi:hypothetical protein